MNYFIIDQINPHTGAFDEHKVVIPKTDTVQLDTVDAALWYLSNYEPTWQGLGAISEVTPRAFNAWMEFGDKSKPFSNSDFAEKTLDLAMVGDAEPDPSKSRHWITTEHGSHILINGKGEVVSGAGGALKGKTFSVPHGAKDVSKHIETVEKIAKAGHEKHGGDYAEYLRMGRNKGSSSHFAREYEKKGIDGLPEGHLREALEDKPKLSMETAKENFISLMSGSDGITEGYKKGLNIALNPDTGSPELMKLLMDTKRELEHKRVNSIAEKGKRGAYKDLAGLLTSNVNNQSTQSPVELQQPIAQPQPENPSLSGLKSLAEQYGEKKAAGETTPSDLGKSTDTLGLIEELRANKKSKIINEGLKNSLINKYDKDIQNQRNDFVSFLKDKISKKQLSKEQALEIQNKLTSIYENNFSKLHTDNSSNIENTIKSFNEGIDRYNELASDYGYDLNISKVDADKSNKLSNELADEIIKHDDDWSEKQAAANSGMGTRYSFSGEDRLAENQNEYKQKTKSIEEKLNNVFSTPDNPNEGIGSGNWERENNDNNNVKPKKLSITRMPSLNTIAEHATKGWNAEKLSDDELAKALMYNRAAQTMRLNNDIIAKIPFSKRHSLSGAASKDLENKILAEYKKRGLDDKYEFDVNVLPKSEKSQQNTQSNAFTPTHESATGEPLQHIEGNLYRDADGNEVEDNYASESKNDLTAKQNNATLSSPSQNETNNKNEGSEMLKKNLKQSVKSEVQKNIANSFKKAFPYSDVLKVERNVEWGSRWDDAKNKDVTDYHTEITFLNKNGIVNKVSVQDFSEHDGYAYKQSFEDSDNPETIDDLIGNKENFALQYFESKSKSVSEISKKLPRYGYEGAVNYIKGKKANGIEIKDKTAVSNFAKNAMDNKIFSQSQYNEFINELNR